ncbi:M14 family zinc carboxypeptidase [Fibrobacterota bacterium]
MMRKLLISNMPRSGSNLPLRTATPCRLFICLLAMVLQGANATDEWGGLFEIPGQLEKTSGAGCGISGDGWGYGYADLEADLIKWSNSPFTTIDSVGSSVQGRTLWMLTITSASGPVSKLSAPLRQVGSSQHKSRIMVHARTHGREVQSTRVVNEIIAFLLDTGAVSQQIRDEFVFNIIPMYNPDGVELGCERMNANGIDMESNWNAPEAEPEVQALRAVFRRLMEDPSPIRVALNLHSSMNLCARFFYYHHENGTSLEFTELEKQFISTTQGFFPGGFENWDFMQSWADGTRLDYPESFFWINYGGDVMALTYEDINDQDPVCPAADKFDSTARALVLGSADYIRRLPFASVDKAEPSRVAPGLFFVPIPGGLRVCSSSKRGWEWKRWKLFLMDGSMIDGGGVSRNRIYWNRPMGDNQVYLLKLFGTNRAEGEALLRVRNKRH